MDWAVGGVAGSLLVAVVMRDVFHTLFHPIGHGSIAPQVMRFVWWLLRLFRPDRRIASLTGPLGIGLVVLTWGGALAVLGWAMLYFALMPEGFAFSSELNPAERHQVFDSLYVSLVTIGTLGFGDVVPTSPVASGDRPARGTVRVHASHRGGVLGSADLSRPAPQTRRGVGTLDSA